MEKNNCNRFTNKICLVTGSSMGIGLATAIRFGEEGATVSICSRDKTNLEKADLQLKSKNIKFASYVCNVNHNVERKKMLEEIKEKFGRIDVLVCNVAVAGIYFGPTMETTEKVYDRYFNTNVKNTFFTIQDSLELLKVSQNSKVLIVSSYTAYTPINLIGIYSVTKTTLIALGSVLAQELANFGIRVNCITPGVIRTKMAESLIDTEYAIQNFMKRVGEPDEVAGLSAFLCSDDSSYVTGETVSVNGGIYGRF